MPTFRLDALVLLKANEAKAWKTSIYSYVKVVEAVVDDMCGILRKGDVDGLQHHLDSICPTIKFTMEVEEGGSLPFLDMRVTRKEDGKLDITVYRKQMHTDRYLHFRSHHLTQMKRGRLYDRARCIAQQGQNLKEEEDHLMKAFDLHPFCLCGQASRGA